MNVPPRREGDFHIELTRRARSKSDLPERRTHSAIALPKTVTHNENAKHDDDDSLLGWFWSFCGVKSGKKTVQKQPPRAEEEKSGDLSSTTTVITKTVHTSVIHPRTKQVLKAFRIGSVVAGYSIERVIGFGGFSVVYQVLRESDHERLAMKVLSIPAEGVVSTKNLEFETDSEFLRRLDHPAILKLHDMGEANGHRYLVYRLFLGEDDTPMTLEDYVRMFDGVLDQWEVSQIFRFLLRAVDHAHHQGLYHLNLKPQNILINVESEVGPHGSCSARLKLSDWGALQMLGEEGFRSVINDHENRKPGSLVAPDHEAIRLSFDYMAPELRGSGRFSQQADVYSLGLILRQLLTGVHENRVFLPTSVNEKLDPGWNKIVNYAVHPDPKKRFRSVTQFSEAIEELDM